MKRLAEQQRLAQYRDRSDNWKHWGPYLSERAWGTVREGYSPQGTAWDSFPHDDARSQLPATVAELARTHPEWRVADGACPACVQDALLYVLLAAGDDALHRQIQEVWPLDAEAAFGAIPTPLRLHADPRFTGSGVTVAIVDTTWPTWRGRAFWRG